MARTDHLNHRPDLGGVRKIERLRKVCIDLEALFDEVVSTSRELSLAKTKLEEARMWAVKGVVMPFPVDEIE